MQYCCYLVFQLRLGDIDLSCASDAPWQNVFIDECIRKGISSAAADRMLQRV